MTLCRSFTLSGCGGALTASTLVLLGCYSPVQATTLYSFTGQSDGSVPRSTVVQMNNSLYGTTFRGGNGTCSDAGIMGCGTVFKLTPGQFGGPWTETVIHHFTLPSGSGAYPEGSLTFDANQALYGTAGGGINQCGFYRCGIVFQLTPVAGGGWTETVLYKFTGGADG
jgi:hypothetical protein